MVAVPSLQMKRLRLREVPQLAGFTQCWRWGSWPVCSKPRAFALFPMMYLSVTTKDDSFSQGQKGLKLIWK